ncbi:MAG: hypothetical protein HC859_01100 [Bacteroidia bacterium]|nr:hypothetical protein [Bacteroidia bacterium]
MIWNYLIVSLRKLWKQRTFSVINTIGLMLGMASCMFILMYVEFETSYDQEVSADVYRVVYHSYQDRVEVGKSAQTVPALAPAMRRDLPEVIDAARLVHTDPLMSDPVMEANEKSFRESHIYYADSSFLSIMNYPLLTGNMATALAQPYSVVISASTARKYFGEVDAVGETMVFHRGERPANTLKVTGVFDDVNTNAHVHPDFLVAFSTLDFDADNDWDWGNFYNYVRLSPETQLSVVHEKLPDMLSQYIGDRSKPSSQYYVTYELQPVHDIHLHSDLWGEAEANGNGTMVMFMGIIALCILLIAWVNYINFSVARSQEHMKEVGIRRMSGSSVMQLWVQASIESAVVNACAVVFAVALLQVLLPALSALAGLPIVLSFTIQHALYIFVLLLAGTMLSGIYPAWLISRHRPDCAVEKAGASRWPFAQQSTHGVSVCRIHHPGHWHAYHPRPTHVHAATGRGLESGKHFGG